MKPSAWLSALLLSSAMACAQTPTLKGHVVGESVQRFLELSPVLRSRVELCRSNPDQVERQDGDEGACTDLLNAIYHGGEVELQESRFTFLLTGPRELDFVGYVEFSGGILTIIGVNFDGVWDDFYPDLLKKFGKPSTTDVIQMQNNYGARYSFPKATWVRPNYVVNVHEDMVTFGQIHFVQVEMVTSSRMLEIEKEKKSQKKSLD
jgi:hypothetical protein